MNTPSTKHLHLCDINVRGDTQARSGVCQTTIDDYAAALDGNQEEGIAPATFPPVVVFYDGATYWLADGFHRYHASAKVDADAIEAVVHQGTRHDALVYACSANDKHGLRPSLADRRYAAGLLLKDEQCASWSDREIGRRAGLDHKTVGKLRRDIGKPQQSTSRKAIVTEADVQPPENDAGEPFEGFGYPPADPKPEAADDDTDDLDQFAQQELEKLGEPPRPAGAEGPRDAVNQAIPNRLHEVFREVEMFTKLQRELGSVNRLITGLSKLPAGKMIRPAVTVDIRNAGAGLKFAKPYAVCPACHGDGCNEGGCKDAGWVTQEQYESWIKAHGPNPANN